jgi:hypothetical protein
VTAKRILIAMLAVAIAAFAITLWRFKTAETPGAPLADATRAGFVRSAIEACTARQKAAPADADVTPETIGRFCACYGETLAGRVTTTDLERLTGKPAAEIQAEMREKTQDIDAVCLARLDEPVGR